MAFLDKIGLEHLWAQIVNQLNTKEDLDNKTTVISETSTDAQYPSAKAVYDRQIDYNALANKPLKMTTVSLLSENWVGGNSPFSQTVVINGITSSSKIDLQPTFTQLLELQDAEITLMITNDNGIATAYAMNNKPTKDYEMQVLITEVLNT